MPGSRDLRFSIQNMSCASCVGRVERALLALPGVDEVNVNLAAETAQARIDSDARIPEVIGALEHAGYPARTQTARLNVSSMSCASCVGMAPAEDFEDELAAAIIARSFARLGGVAGRGEYGPEVGECSRSWLDWHPHAEVEDEVVGQAQAALPVRTVLSPGPCVG